MAQCDFWQGVLENLASVKAAQITTEVALATNESDISTVEANINGFRSYQNTRTGVIRIPTCTGGALDGWTVQFRFMRRADRVEVYLENIYGGVNPLAGLGGEMTLTNAIPDNQGLRPRDAFHTVTVVPGWNSASGAVDQPGLLTFMFTFRTDGSVKMRHVIKSAANSTLIIGDLPAGTTEMNYPAATTIYLGDYDNGDPKHPVIPL